MHLVGRRRLLLLVSMAHRPAAWRASGMGGVRRILLTGMCHRALGRMLWEWILARRCVRRRLQWRGSLAMEAC